MKKQVEMIYLKKNKQKKQLEQIKNNYLATIYEGLSKHKSKRQIHKELYNMTINQKVYSRNLYAQALKILSVVNKQVPRKESEIKRLTSVKFDVSNITSVEILTSMILFDTFKKNDVDKVMERTIFKDLNKIEGDEKKNMLKENLAENRMLSLPRIFYLASSHNDCAEDHLQAQGKIYVDEKWESVVKDKQLAKEIKNYIRLHNIKTLQYITGKPVWFITRPNCRHYVKAISTEDVLKKSVKTLIKENNTHTEIGNRTYLQVLKHDTRKQWYQDKQNVINILNKYKERLKYHKSLYRRVNNDLLANAIKKDLFLIKKWNSYLKTY